MKQLITYIGLDVHKETIAVALAEAGKRNEVREYGEIANTPAAVKTLVAKLARNGHELRFCYEAGPCGYGIQRQLTASEHECIVVAPSLIPRRPGERIKTDRRDAINLAKLHRAGELTPVWVPDEAHEAIRDPRVKPEDKPGAGASGSRADTSSGSPATVGLPARHGHHYNRPAWTLMHALQALRGMALVAAATLVAELGDITRFANPRQLMAYLGLVPSEHSSGGTRRQGGITKAGNGTARRMLIEAAWSYRFPARISREQLLRQEDLSKPIRDIAWKAQERLCRRYRNLARAGKPPTVVTAAIARELAGFVWAIAKQATH